MTEKDKKNKGETDKENIIAQNINLQNVKSV